MAAGKRSASLELRLIDLVSKPARDATRSIERLNKAMRSLRGISIPGMRMPRIPGLPGMPGAPGAPAYPGGGRPRPGGFFPGAPGAGWVAGAGRGGLSSGSGRAERGATRAESMAFSAPVLGAAALGARSVYDYEKAGNKMQAFGLLTDQQRVNLEAYAQLLNKDFPQTNKDIIESAQELFRAGFTYEQAMGSLRGTLQLAMAGDLSNRESADIATNVLTAMRMPMATNEQIAESMQIVLDSLAYAATKSNTDVRLMGDTFRYVAPLAATAGMSIEEVTAISMQLANNGIKGAEAGVALRSSLVRLARPTKPMLAAMERLNLNMADFVDYKERIEADSIIGSLLPEGYDLSNLRGEIQAILDDKTLGAAPTRMAANLTDLIVGNIGDETVRDTISEAMNDAVIAGAQRIDLFKFLKTLREKNATITDIAQIFDIRMGSRLAAVLYNDLDGALERVKAEYRGVGAEMAGLMMAGIVGTVAEVSAAVENLFVTLAESGVMDTVASVLERFTASVQTLATANPALLEFGTYATLALAAAAPLGFALAGLASAASILASPLGLAVVGLGSLAAMNFDAVSDFVTVFANSAGGAFSPDLVARVQAIGAGIRDLFSGGLVTEENADAFGQIARNLGIRFAETANTIFESGPKIRQGAQDLLAFASSSIAGNVDQIGSGLSALREGFDNLLGSKIEGLRDLATSIVDFAERAGPFLQPAAYAGIDLVAESFQTLGAGFGAVTRVIGGVTEGFVSFVTALYDNVDNAAIESIGNGLTSMLNGLREVLGPLRDIFSAINLDVSSFASDAGASLGRGISAVINAVANGRETLSAAWERLKEIFAAIGSYVPSFGGIVGAVSSFVNRIAGLADTLAGAVERIRNAVQNLPSGAVGALVGGPGLVSGGAPATTPGAAIGAAVGTGNLPRRRSGGAVRRGSYLVGEAGPEVVHMGGNGYVTPNHKLSDGGGVTVDLRGATFHGVRPSDAEQFAQDLGRRLSRSRSISMSGRPKY